MAEHAREHLEELFVVAPEARRLVGQRGERADARAVGQLERHAQVRPGAGAALHPDQCVYRVGVEVVAEPRRAFLDHREVEGVGERRGEVRAQAERAAAALLDDPVHRVGAVEVCEVDRRVRHHPLEQVEHGARGVGE